MAASHIVQGLDGKPSLWPVNAVSRDSNGVFRDIKGRRVAAVADRLAAAMDSAQPAKRKPVAKDSSAEDALIRRLMPTLKKMAASSAAAEDDADAEQEALFSGTAEDEGTNIYAEGMSSYAEAKAYWNGVAERNKAGRGRAYTPVAANASKGH